MFLQFLLLWQSHWCTPGCWPSRTSSRRYENCYLNVYWIYFNDPNNHGAALPNKQETDGSLIPPSIPLSSEHVNDDGIYLLENGEDCLIYVGNSVDLGVMRQLFGISSLDEIQPQVFLFCIIGHDVYSALWYH